MKVIENFLQEFKPENPSDILVKNKFYPAGITKGQVYDYYIKRKRDILNWVGNRNVAFMLRMDNDLIVKRKHKGSKIKLTSSNYDSIITGRTNVIMVEHSTPTDYFVIDVDPGTNMSRKETIEAITFVREILEDELKMSRYESITTSYNGAHFIGYLKNKWNIDKLRTKIYK